MSAGIIMETIDTKQRDEDEPCEVCQGRAAWASGQARDSNPYPQPNTDTTSDLDRYENPWVLWNIGWETGQPIANAIEALTATGQIKESDLEP